MLPIHDDNPSGRTAYVTYALIALNILAFGYQLLLPEAGLERFYLNFAVVPKLLVTGGEPLGYLPLLTAMFLHGGFMHLGGNMLFLYIFGDNVEDRLGHVPYLAFYLAAGVAASLAHVWSGPGSMVPMLGASGAIGGVLGAYIVLHPQARITTLVFLGFFVTHFRIPAFVFLGIWFALQSLQGLVSLGGPEAGGTAWWAHIGGFVAGMIVGAAARAIPQRALPNDDIRRISSRR